MIFQKSLAKKKGRAYAFFSGLVSGIVPAILLFVYTLAITFASALANFILLKDGLSENEKLSDTVKFIIGFDDSLAISDSMSLVMILFAGIGILMAIRLFSFSADKKTVNVYYSLGIKRSTMFASKFFAGAVLICLGIAIPIILTYFVNVAFVGASFQLSLALFHFYSGFSLTALFCFALTLAVFSSVGSVFEGVVFSGVLTGAPALIGLFSETFAGIFLKNSVISLYGNYYTDINGEWYQMKESLSSFFIKVNPIAFFSSSFELYSSCDISSDGSLLLSGSQKWTSPDFLAIFPWFFAFAAVSLIALFLFKRRKSENCGFLDTNKFLSNLTISIVVFFAFYAGFYTNYSEYRKELTSPLIIGFCIAIPAYLVTDFLLKRNLKNLLKGLGKLPLHLALVAVVLVAFNISNSLYASYIPDNEKIDSVSISVIASPSSMSVLGELTFSGYYTENGIVSNEVYYPVMLTDMTNKDDINLVLDIHKKLIETNDNEEKLKYSAVYIIYKLKDGSTKSRKYEVADEETLEMLYSCYNTVAAKEKINEFFTDDTDVQGPPMLSYEWADVTAVNANTQEGYELNLTKEQFDGLKQAIKKDLLNLTFEEYTSSLNKQYGFIRFSTYVNYIYNGDEYEIWDDSFWDEEISGDDIISKFPDEEIADETDEIAEKTDEILTKVYQTFDYIFCNYTNSFDVLISEKMVNTLNYLKGIGCENCFENTLTIKSLSFVNFDFETVTNYDDRFWSEETLLREIIPVAESYYYDEGYSITVEGENKITDENLIAQIIDKCAIYSLSNTKGYLCIAEYDNTAMTKYGMYFIPSELAPQEITNFNYSLVVPTIK